MKKQFFNYTLLSFLTFISFCFVAKAQNIEVKAKLQDYTIKIGDQTRLFLVVHQPVRSQINFPKLTDTLTGKVQVINAGKPDTLLDKSDPKQETVTQSFIITSFDAGTYNIPPFVFGTTGGVLKTNELSLVVQTVQVDTTKAIYDIKQPLTVTYSFLDWLKDNWVWVAIGIVAIIAIIAAIWYYRKHPKLEPLAKIVVPVIPAHITAITKLNELRNKKLWQQDEVKQYYIELSDIVREYLEKRYLVKTHEKTTDEIFAGLKNMRLNEENDQLLRKILVLSDLVKFAKEKPVPAENEESLNKAIVFVKSTQYQESPQKEEGGKPDV